MNKKALIIFHALMKKGWIDRSENTEIWKYYEDSDIQEELEIMGEELCFYIIRSGDRIYLVPTQDNDLFLKNNIDFRKDINADNEVRRNDIYLMNYLSMYLIYLFYHGEGNDPKCREFISLEDAVKEFSEHCKSAVKNVKISDQNDYSDNFIQLAQAWLSKTDGNIDSRKLNDRYGLFNRLLIKFGPKHDDLFDLNAGIIRPTRKLDDIIPYFLRKERIAEIQKMINEVKKDAADI